jgi:hypothetical protein
VTKAAIILGVLAIIAAFVVGGRYSLTSQGNMAFVVDRFTGSVRFCSREECSAVPDKKEPWGVVKQDPWPGVKQDTPVPPPQEKGPWTQYQKQ